MPTSLGAAVGLGLRALARESWLLAVGVLVAIARRAAIWPAWAVAVALLWGGAAAALALTLALGVPLALSVLADAAVARAAARCEGPGRAFATATRGLLARPGTFVLAAMGFAAAGPIASLVVEAMGGALTGLAVAGSPFLLAGPNLMLALLAIAMGAAVDLWWLGTVAALSCGGRSRESIGRGSHSVVRACARVPQAPSEGESRRFMMLTSLDPSRT